MLSFGLDVAPSSVPLRALYDVNFMQLHLSKRRRYGSTDCHALRNFWTRSGIVVVYDDDLLSWDSIR